MEASFIGRETHLEVTCEGFWNVDHIVNILHTTKQQAVEQSCFRIFIHALKVTAPQSEYQRFLIGETIADIFPRPYKLAALYPSELINKFAENTAVNRGALFLVTDSEPAAMQWLLEGN